MKGSEKVPQLVGPENGLARFLSARPGHRFPGDPVHFDLSLYECREGAHGFLEPDALAARKPSEHGGLQRDADAVGQSIPAANQLPVDHQDVVDESTSACHRADAAEPA